MSHSHVERGGLASRPRVPSNYQTTLTTASTITLVAADPNKKTVLYHLTLSNSEGDTSTVTLRFGSTVIFRFHLPADGGNILCNFYGTELSTAYNEAVTATLAAVGNMDVSVCYIQV